MRPACNSLLLVTAFFATVTIPSIVLGQQAGEQEDKTGTNPTNFQREFRVYNEYSWLDAAGDASQNLTTFEYRMPIVDGKWQWRVRGRYNSLSADTNNNGIDNIDASGVGDLDMRFLTVPILDLANRQAFAYGVEVFLDTASESALGTGTTALGPQAFFVKFLDSGLFAPGIQYKFSIDEDTGRSDVEQILIDLNFLKMAGDQQSWFFTDPQLVFDRETKKEFSIVDFEFGWMMSNWTDLQGHSFFVRPSIGIGADRPTDYSIEIGYKIVGF